MKSIVLAVLLFLSMPLEAFGANETAPKQDTVIHEAQYVGGGLVGTLIGFGTGHAIQERYLNKGLIFTLGEFGTQLFAAACFTSGCPDGLFLASFAGFIGLRIWEIVDVWMIRSSGVRVADSSESPEVTLTYVPLIRDGHMTSGLRLTYAF
jgi:hypothetical protein